MLGFPVDVSFIFPTANYIFSQYLQLGVGEEQRGWGAFEVLPELY